MASPPHHVEIHGEHRTLDINLFSPQNLSTEGGLADAFVALDRLWWHENFEPLEFTLRVLMNGPHNLLIYIVAVALDERMYDQLLSKLLGTFPLTASTFSSSLASDLINHLREFYIRIFCPDVPRSLNDCHRDVALALHAFKALGELKLDFDLSPPSNHGKMDTVKYKQTQRERKHARQKSRSISATDSAPFSALGCQVPRTKEEITDLQQILLQGQKEILEKYLSVLRLPALASTITKLYFFSEIPSVPQATDTETNTIQVTESLRDVSSSPEVHPAYPHIQPLKAAKYFSEPAEGFGPWHILLSTRAIKHVKGFRRDENTRWLIIKKKLQQLSDGHFSDSNQKRLRGSDTGVPIYEAKMDGDLRLIYQIDLAPDDATGNDHQVIKVWGIHTHAQMDHRLWESITYHQSSFTGEYRRRCLHRETPKQPGKDVILPASWPNHVEKQVNQDVPQNRDKMSTEEQLELHSILALEKFTRMSQALMNSILAGRDDVYPFELTCPEQEIRDHPSSCFVLGRSGTGKTTTMVFKMIAREMLNIQQITETAADTSPAPKYRQMFVTQSRILAGRVQDYFGRMLMSQSVGQKTTQEIQRLALRHQRASDGEDMLDVDEDEEDERSDLPKKFSELEDHHFPLFLTVSQLCRLLESDCNLSFKRRPRTKEHRRAEQQSYSAKVDDDMSLDDDDLVKDDTWANRLTVFNRTIEQSPIITFETFFYIYWPHFPQSLTKGLDPALVWNEFMGVIKGSEESLDTQDGTSFLDRSTYMNLSHRRQSTFAKQRDRIYNIFESYHRLKRERGDYDAADRTHAILEALNGDVPSGGQKVDFLYVDEAQDNLMVDACLLRQLCSNPHGQFWAGDTAQTIAMGSSFRFNDLKAFLHRTEEKSCTSGLRAPVHPESFQLAINYRSHAGVVNCAYSVVELIAQFWPNSLDSLARERGVVDGPRPVLFCGWDSEESRYEQFLFHESGNIDFGAQQCILVRDERAREVLRREIGDVGLIMTLYESKGLEFNDVLLFNFFVDSTATLSEWRVILNAVDESKRGQVGVPRFEEIRHASLCSELKSLYVGITRARCHVRILDIPKKAGEPRGEPMRIFWESKNLIQTCRPGDPVPELVVSSTPEQWAQKGHELFKTKHYQQAIFCFEKAGRLLERSTAHAYMLRRAAHRISPLSKQVTSKRTSYLRAAEAFVVCVGLCPSSATQSRYLTLAADCYVAAEAHASAAQAYFGAEKFTEAAQAFKCAKLFDEAADIVLLHRNDVDPVVAKSCLENARFHLHREHQLKKAARLFDSLEEQLEYLEEYEFDIARIRLLQELERWSDAAEIHYAEGRPLDAIPLWIRASDPESRRRASTALLDSLWTAFPLGKVPDEKERIRYLDFLRNLSSEPTDKTRQDESSMFLAILANDHGQLLRLSREFRYGPQENPTAALLCLDNALKKPPQMHNDDGKSVTKYLEDYDSYGRLMRKVILDSRNSHGAQLPRFAKLLGFMEKSDSAIDGVPVRFDVLPTSILYEHVKNESAFPHSIDESISIASHHLSRVIFQVLGQRLRERLLDEHDICLRSKSFRPCLQFSIYAECGRMECRREHLHGDSLGIEAFNVRTRLHLQQILIVHNMNISLDFGECRKLQRIWQERFYQTLFPVFYTFGDISALTKPRRSNLSSPDAVAFSRLWSSSILEHQRASKVLSDWLPDRFYSLRPFRDDPDDKFITDAVQTAMLAFAIDRHNAAHYLLRSDCVVKYRHPRLLRSQGYIIHDLLHFLKGSSKTSVIHGVQFIKHVLEQRIPIDANTLLNLFEAVVGRAIIASRYSLHQATLPRSWIVKFLSTWDEQYKQPNAYLAIVQDLFPPLVTLLEGIWSNKDVDYIMYDRYSFATGRVPFVARTVIIFRICKSLALLGYNLRNNKLRGMIQKILASLWRPDRKFPPLIAPYVKAERWADLARAVRSSTDSPLDGMIYLGESECLPSNCTQPPGVKLLRFDSISSVLPALEYVAASNFNPEAKPFVPNSIVQQPPTLPDAEPIEDDSTVDEPFRTETEPIEVIGPNDLSVERTETEITAAIKIQVWYRRSLGMKSSVISEITGSRLRCISASQVEVKKLHVSPLYRRLFLGPLPHVLTALQGCGNALQNTKRVIKKRLMSTSEVLDYDEYKSTFTDCNRLIKAQKQIWKELEPSAKLHHDGSVEELRKRVEDVDSLVKKTLAMTQSIQDLLWDMSIGYKGIVQRAYTQPTSKATRRPSLNTEDIDG